MRGVTIVGPPQQQRIKNDEGVVNIKIIVGACSPLMGPLRGIELLLSCMSCSQREGLGGLRPIKHTPGIQMRGLQLGMIITEESERGRPCPSQGNQLRVSAFPSSSEQLRAAAPSSNEKPRAFTSSSEQLREATSSPEESRAIPSSPE